MTRSESCVASVREASSCGAAHLLLLYSEISHLGAQLFDLLGRSQDLRLQVANIFLALPLVVSEGLVGCHLHPLRGKRDRLWWVAVALTTRALGRYESRAVPVKPVKVGSQMSLGHSTVQVFVSEWHVQITYMG